MVPPEFRRKFTIISGVVSLIEAILWALIAIYSVGVYHCVFPVPFLQSSATSISEWDLLYQTYFDGRCQANNFDLNTIPESSSSTELWMIVYGVVSSVWIPACILLIVAAAGKVRGVYASYLYYPWIVVTAVLIVIDLVAAILHLNDLFKTLSKDAYAQFLTGDSSSTWDSLTLLLAPTTYTPSLVLTLLFCRGVVLWLVHVVMLITIVRACNAVAMYKAKYQQTISLTNSSGSDRNWLNVFYQGPDTSLVVERSRSDRSDEQASIRAGIDSPFQDSIRDSEEIQTSVPAEMSKKPQFEEMIPRVGSRRNSLERSNSVQNKGRVFDYLGRPSSFRNMSPGRSPNRIEHMPPAELRNQMPFSYFQPMNALPPKPIQRSVSEDAPPVPVPDYTLHFNRNPMSSPGTPANKPRVIRKATEEYFKFPPPINRQNAVAPEPYYPAQSGVRYVPPVRPHPLAYGVQVYPQTPVTPQTPESYVSFSRNLGMESSRR